MVGVIPDCSEGKGFPRQRRIASITVAYPSCAKDLQRKEGIIQCNPAVFVPGLVTRLKFQARRVASVTSRRFTAPKCFCNCCSMVHACFELLGQAQMCRGLSVRTSSFQFPLSVSEQRVRETAYKSMIIVLPSRWIESIQHVCSRQRNVWVLLIEFQRFIFVQIWIICVETFLYQ